MIYDSGMLQSIFSLHQHKPYFKQVCSLFSLFTVNHCFFTTSSVESTHKINSTQLDKSSINFSGIAKSVALRCSHLWDKKVDTFVNFSLKDSLLKLSYISPKTTRRFLRISELKPGDVLEILLGFECYDGKFENKVKKVESLWGIFKWASEQSRDFKHLPQSCKIMASMLVEVQLFRDAEVLLSKEENQGILLDSQEIFSNLIEGYVVTDEVKRATSLYDRMRGIGLVPSLGGYHVLLNKLVQLSETQLAIQVFVDMVENGLGTSLEGKRIYQNVTQLLCAAGKVQEARNLVKKIAAFGLKPNKFVLNAIATGYCEKKDYDDLLSFFTEMKCAPSVICGNKIIFSLCKNFGAEEAFFLMQELEILGFFPDEKTFGILIGWSCRERKLKDAFIYHSDILSRGLTPHIYSYNALISGVFKEQMWKHAKEILHEMHDRGITPEMSTFRVLLAGYCKARQFDEVKVVVSNMVDHGLVQLTPVEDPLLKAFMVLGFNPSSVKMRRDNDTGFTRTEFFDNIGNGLYLDTDVDEFEKTTTQVLDDSMIPDINTLVLKYICHKNLKPTLLLVDDMLRWGQELSLSVFSTVLKGLCASRCGIKPITSLLEKMPKLSNQLDQETLNVLVQAHIKRGHASKAKIIFDGMLQRRLEIANKTYTALIIDLCRTGDMRCIQQCWKLAREDRWLLELEDCKALIGCLCQREMLKEALELFESMLLAYPHIESELCHAVLECFCDTGFSVTAHALAEELLKLGCILDLMAYDHLMRGFCKEKRFSEASVLYDVIFAKNLAPKFDVPVQLIPELCRVHDLKKSILREQPLVSLSVHDLMSGFCKTGMVGEAAMLLQDMLLKGICPDVEVYNILLQGYCRSKNFRKVLELLGFLIRKSIHISTLSYRNLVSLMCMEGRISSALSVKEFMLKESKPSYVFIYNILIFYLFSSGNSMIVDTVLKEFQERELQLDEATYNFVVYGFSCCKSVSRALHYLTTMMSKDIRPSNRCLRAVIKCLCQDGNLKTALELSREMEILGRFHDSIIQNNIVEGLLNHGKLQEAVDFLDRMEKGSLIPENIIYDNLIKRLCCYGRQDKAAHLLDIMLRNGNIPSSTSYDYLIQGFCMCHKLSEALDLHSEMLHRNLHPCIDTWSTLVQKVCADGKPAEAEVLLSSMVETGEIPSKEMYCSVIDKYCFDKNFSKASELLEAMRQNGYEPDFATHWSLIRNLSISSDKDKSKNSPRFLSRLLSASGFSRKGDQ